MRDENSRPDPSTTVWSLDSEGEKENVPVRHLEAPRCRLYENFCKEYYIEVDNIRKPAISHAQFYREIPVQFKDAKHETGTRFLFDHPTDQPPAFFLHHYDSDKCDICFSAHPARTKMAGYVKKYPEGTDITEWDNDDQLIYLSLESLLESVDKHRELVKHQRNACKEQIQDAQPGRVIAIMDYKAKVILGKSKIQLGHEFYESPMRSLLGVTLLIHPDDIERVLGDPNSAQLVDIHVWI